MATPQERARDLVLEVVSGSAHRAIQPNDKQGALAHGTVRTTHNRWARGEPSAPLFRAGQYLLRCRDPWRGLANMEINAVWSDQKEKGTPELVRRWRECGDEIADAMAELAKLQVRVACDPEAVKALSVVREQLAARHMETAGIERELASRKINPANWSVDSWSR